MIPRCRRGVNGMDVGVVREKKVGVTGNLVVAKGMVESESGAE